MRLSVLMPVYNEAATLLPVVKRVLDVDYPCDMQLVAVDDGSSDDSAALLEAVDDPRLVLHRHPVNRGKGAAVATAAAVATGDYLIMCDADLEYAPEEIPHLLAPVLRGEATVVYGTRTFGSHTAYSFWYVMGNKCVTLAANVLFNAYISDLETCFKLLPTALYRELRIASAGFGMEAEITGKLLARGIRPYEVPISYRARSREEGKKLTWRDGVEALVILGRIRARTWRGRTRAGRAADSVPAVAVRPPGQPPPQGARARRREAAVALLGFSLLSCAWFLPVLRAPLTSTVSGAAGDLTIFAWFLTWVPWAVLHGHDPFVSQYLLWPGGVSTMWNTGLLLLSVLLAPVTLTLGPVATLNVLFLAAPASSAFAAWLLLRRHVSVWPATAGALLYGFGPAMAAQHLGHLQLSILTLPPLIVMAVEDLLQPQGHTTRRTGVRLGVLVASQLLIGEELLAITALSVAVWLAALAVCAPGAVRPALPRLLAGTAVTLAVTLPLAGVPLAYQFLGPLQVHEPIQAAVLNVMRPRDLVEPTSRLVLHRGPGPEHSNVSEVGGYLGWPLLALLTLGVALQWRRPAVRAVAGVLGVLEVLALGPYLTQADPTSQRLPWAAVDGLPILENILPIRFALAAALTAAVLLALTLDRLRQRSPALAVTAAVAALLPLLPHGWPVLPAPGRPDCLRQPALDRLAADEPTLLLRYPVLPALATQLWHAEAHFPFPIAGGYAVHPDRATGLPVLDGDRDAAALAFRQLGAGGAGPLPGGVDVLAALRDMRITRVLVTPSPSAEAERTFLEREMRLVPVAVADCTLYAVR